MADDELSKYRTAKRRQVALQLTRIGLRLAWSPHWELEFRLSGRWWFFWFGLPTVLFTTATYAIGMSRLIAWIVADDRRTAALYGAATGIAIIALAQRWTRRKKEDQP